MRFVPLPRSFYEPSAKVVAPKLLGHWLVRRTKDGACGGPIVETEAYLVDDPAAHGFIGETPRNRIMFGPPGYAYVYFIYGCHFCVNVVCHSVGHAEAVLIRAIEPQFGESLMRKNRATALDLNLTNGPAKLCAAMNIARDLGGTDLCDAHSPLLIAENPDRAAWARARDPIITTTRIGLTKAADRPLRYYLDKSRFISRREKSTSARTIRPAVPASRASKKR